MAFFLVRILQHMNGIFLIAVKRTNSACLQRWRYPCLEIASILMYSYLTSLSKDVFTSASTHIFTSQHYSSSIDLSNMYSPSTITCSISAVNSISFSIGSFSAWSKDGKSIGKFFLYFTSFILFLNFSRSKV